jgi:phage terminase small subunit
MAPNGGTAGGSIGLRGASNASQNASENQQHTARKPPNHTKDADAHWRKIIDYLNEVGDDLKKDTSKSPLYNKV